MLIWAHPKSLYLTVSWGSPSLACCKFYSAIPSPSSSSNLWIYTSPTQQFLSILSSQAPHLICLSSKALSSVPPTLPLSCHHHFSPRSSSSVYLHSISPVTLHTVPGRMLPTQSLILELHWLLINHWGAWPMGLTTAQPQVKLCLPAEKFPRKSDGEEKGTEYSTLCFFRC
jgi:hypothetical protein